MQDIRIFIASSKELNQERNELAFLVLAHEDEFAKRGLRVRLSKWEYVDPKMTAGRSEDRYLDEMYNCDAAMVIFKNITGMYTREELDKALAREAAGSDRIKTHKILFSAEGKPDSDAAKLRASLSADSYGIYENSEGLQKEFLALVDQLVEMDRSGTPGKKLLEAAPDAHVRRITAFLAADEELMADRNAFADTVLNLNDLLESRNLRVQLRFCGTGLPKAKMRELVASSEMGLVLYGTNIRAFGHEEMDFACNRTNRDENPKKLYVFFRDEEGKDLSPEFKAFRDSFVVKRGHFVCQFGGPDSLRLAFLFFLERYAGETVEVYSTVTPPTASVFVGRETELRQLTDLLTVTPTFPAGRMPIVTGAGGTGKSELVRQYATQLRVRYPGGVFQVDMETRRTWNDVFLGMLAVKSNGGGNNGVDIFECLGLKKEEAEKTTGADVRNALLKRARDCGPVLLVLDNLEHCEELIGENAFAEAFPAGFSERVSVNVIATARTCDAPLSKNDWAQVFPLGDLSPESALELLFANKPAESEDEVRAAKRVAELLGYRALFLRRVPMILNGVNKKSRIVCRNYTTLARVLEEDPLLTISRTATVDETHLPSRLWELVRNNLSEWGLGEAYIKLIEIASFFSPDGFPQHILRHLWKELVFPGLEDRGTEEEVFDQVVDLAKNYNIFQSADPVRIHRLDRAAILETTKRGPDLEDSIGAVLTSSCLLLKQDWVQLSEHNRIFAHLPKELSEDKSFWVELITHDPSYADRCPWNKFDGSDWVHVLSRNPAFSTHCPWEKLDAFHCSSLIIKRPEFIQYCPLEKLNGAAWVVLLIHQPTFADNCWWQKLNGWNWSDLLQVCPQFAAHCPWNKFHGRDWAMLLRKQPQFAELCTWDKFDGRDWSAFLCTQPQFADKCQWDMLDCWDWKNLLLQQPLFSERCDWGKLKKASHRAWRQLLCVQPQFAVHCPYGMLDASDWTCIMRKQPSLIDVCPVSERNGHYWSGLLTVRPRESGVCPWEEFDGKDWLNLIVVQPQFAERCPWEKIIVDTHLEDDWCRILKSQPQLAVAHIPQEMLHNAFVHCLCQATESTVYKILHDIKSDGLSALTWITLLRKQPQFAAKCPWGILTGNEWQWLLRGQPQFADRCEWQKLSGGDWCELLRYQPQFSDRCEWNMLGVTDWKRLLLRQPQFLRYCPKAIADGENLENFVQTHRGFDRIASGTFANPPKV